MLSQLGIISVWLPQKTAIPEGGAEVHIFFNDLEASVRALSIEGNWVYLNSRYSLLAVRLHSPDIYKITVL